MTRLYLETSQSGDRAVFVQWDDRGPIYRVDREGRTTEQLRVPEGAEEVEI